MYRCSNHIYTESFLFALTDSNTVTEPCGSIKMNTNGCDISSEMFVLFCYRLPYITHIRNIDFRL